MKINELRRATIDDIPRIIQLTQTFEVTRESVHPGFLEFPKISADEYYTRIKSSNFCYVAVDHEVNGFLLAYPRACLHQGIVAGPISGKLIQFDGDFVYLEQVAVAPTRQRRGIANALFEKVLNEAKSDFRIAYGATSHQPITNTPTINLLKKTGFVVKEEIRFNNLTFGLYSKGLDNVL